MSCLLPQGNGAKFPAFRRVGFGDPDRAVEAGEQLERRGRPSAAPCHNGIGGQEKKLLSTTAEANIIFWVRPRLPFPGRPLGGVALTPQSYRETTPALP